MCEDELGDLRPKIQLLMRKNVLLIGLLTFVQFGHAQGILDVEFADLGQFVFFQESPNLTYTHDIIVDSENRIVVCGQHFESNATSSAFALRMFQDGTLDASFGTNGVATFASETIQSQDFIGIRELDNGHYVAIGGVQPEFDVLHVYLTELDESGSLLSELGGGQPSAVISASSYNYRFALKPDGKFLLSYTFNPYQNLFPTAGDVFLMQFNEDGTPDDSFGGNGLFTYGVDQADDRTYDIGIDGNGTIYLSGYTRAGFEFGVLTKALILGITPLGVLLSTFGDGGVALVADAQANLSATAMDVTSANEFVFAGFRYSPSDFQQLGMIGKMNASGDLVGSFGETGIRLLPDYLNGELFAIEELADGQIVAAGRHTGNNYDVILTKLNASGAFVSGFGNGGTTASWDLEGGDDFPHQMAIDETGNILVTGRAQANSGGGGDVINSETRSGGGGGGFSSELAFVLRYSNQLVLSVAHFESPFSISLFPNPAREFIQIRARANEPIYLSDHTGRLIRQINMYSSSSVLVSISDLPSGVYYFRQSEQVCRFIKQ